MSGVPYTHLGNCYSSSRWRCSELIPSLSPRAKLLRDGPSQGIVGSRKGDTDALSHDSLFPSRSEGAQNGWVPSPSHLFSISEEKGQPWTLINNLNRILKGWKSLGFLAFSYYLGFSAHAGQPYIIISHQNFSYLRTVFLRGHGFPWNFL